MIDPINTIWALSKFIIAFILLYILLPSRVIKFEEESGSIIDRIFISLTHSNFIIIIIVHLLSFLKLYETFSLLFACAAIYCFAATFKEPGSFTSVLDAFGLKVVIKIFDMSEKEGGFKKELLSGLKSRILRLKTLLKEQTRSIIAKPLKIIPFAFILISAAYSRFHHSLTHLYVGASDVYVHLAWSKYLGSNNIYAPNFAAMDETSAGIYPYGFHSIISAIHKLFFIDPYQIVRFIGALSGFLIVLSLFYVLVKNFKSGHAVWLSVFLYVVSIGLPSDIWRQISALPQEYAAIFLFPGIHFFNMYFRTGKFSYLLLSAECLSLTLLIHPYVTVFLLIGYAAAGIFNIRKLLSLNVLFKTGILMAASSFIGVLPLIIGYLSGIPFHGSFGYVQESTKMSQSIDVFDKLKNFTERNTSLRAFLYCFLLFLVFMLLFIIFNIFKKNVKFLSNTEEIGFYSIAAIFSFLLYFIYAAQRAGIFAIMDTNRVGIFLSMSVVFIYAFPLNLLDIIKNTSVRNAAKTLVCALLFALFFKLPMPLGDQLEYNESVAAYMKIKSSYTANNWTIISPVEQYSQCIGYGWHYELWEFVQAISEPDNYEIAIPTDYVFLFVEKYPFGSSEPINHNDMDKELPQITGELDRYYKDVEYRRIIQAKAHAWAESYILTHDNMSVFMENDRMKIYMIEQDGSKEIDLLK